MVADGEALAEATKLASTLAQGPTGAFSAVKDLLNGTFDQTLESQMELEARAIAGLVATTDGQEGINAFVEKRKPEFKGS